MPALPLAWSANVAMPPLQIEDSCEQLSWVAAFTVSSYATTAARTAKPFNPLLGETYECDRTADLGWRAINEQVSAREQLGWRKYLCYHEGNVVLLLY